jgi:hypothetical protein
MANKWRTDVADALWVKEAYNDDPANPSAKVLVRAIYGINRQSTTGIIDTLNATKSVTDPYADGVAITGTFRVIKNESRPSEEGNTAGSDVIIQTLGQGHFTTLSASNKFVVKYDYETEEQNENAWMYYARGTVVETSRWVNIAPTSIAGLFPYTTSVSFDTTLVGYGDPVIQLNWYEKEQDGSYSMYRTLFARATTATVQYRDVQYAGMLLTDTAAPPMEGDVTLKISGFRNTTETVYQHAKFSIAGDTYRVTANATAVAGVVTVAINPEISAATEAACDTIDGSAIQVYPEALT